MCKVFLSGMSLSLVLPQLRSEKTPASFRWERATGIWSLTRSCFWKLHSSWLPKVPDILSQDTVLHLAYLTCPKWKAEASNTKGIYNHIFVMLVLLLASWPQQGSCWVYDVQVLRLNQRCSDTYWDAVF